MMVLDKVHEHSNILLEALKQQFMQIVKRSALTIFSGRISSALIADTLVTRVL